MKNYVQKGDVVTLAAPYDRLSGQGAQVGSVFGVAAVDVLSGVSAEFQTEGVFDITKDTSVFAQGDKVYWDDSAKKCSSTAGYPIGSAMKAQLTGDSTVRVNLEPPARISATVAAEATANGSDAATTQALANALKTKVNAILSALKAAGLMQ